MSTPILNKTDDPIKTDAIAPDSPLLTFINSKVSQRLIYCQECFKAKGELIAVRLNIEGDHAVFSHDNCVLNPPNPKPEVKHFMVTEEGWTYDPPLNIGDRCVIVSGYYHEWLFKTSKKQGHANKIDDAYRQQQGDWIEKWVNREVTFTKIRDFDCRATMVLVADNGDGMVTVQRAEGGDGTRRTLPLKVLWTLENPKA